MMRVALILLPLSLIFMTGACRSATDGDASSDSDTTSAPAEDQAFTIIGTVQHIAIEGGFYGIVAENGRRYDPMNLPEAFRVDGLPVVCRARLAANMASFHMWGQLIEIVDIQRR